MQEIAVAPNRSATRIGLLRARAVHRAAQLSATCNHEGWLNGRFMAGERALAVVGRPLVMLHGAAVAGEVLEAAVEASEVAGGADGVPT
jgi:hypothetical protein